MSRPSVSWPTASLLSALSLCMWVASITQTGLVLYADQQALSGLQILLSGWLSPLALNFAWYANPLLILAALTTLGGRVPYKMSIAAFVLSLDSLRFDTMLMNEGGSVSPVFGYGWGYVLWMLAMATQLLAVGVASSESGKSQGLRDSSKRVLLRCGVAATAVILVSSGGLWLLDHLRANASEAQRLEGLAFKRDAVCRMETDLQLVPLQSMALPLEVRYSDPDMASYGYPFPNVETLLAWGVPVVRASGKDFRLSPHAGGHLLTSTDAAGPTGAVLMLGAQKMERPHWRANSPKILRAKLVETATGRVVFDQEWTEEAGPLRYCPDFQSNPRHEDQPRRLFMKGFGLADTKLPTEPARVQQAADNGMTALLVSHVELPDVATNARQSPPGKDGEGADNAYSIPDPANCPSDIRWPSEEETSVATSIEGRRPLWIGGNFYYPERQLRYSAYCAEGFIYLSYDRPTQEYHYLTIEKRRIDDFGIEWNGIIKIDQDTIAHEHANLRNSRLRVIGIEDDVHEIRVLVGSQGIRIATWLKAERKRKPLSDSQ